MLWNGGLLGSLYICAPSEIFWDFRRMGIVGGVGVVGGSDPRLRCLYIGAFVGARSDTHRAPRVGEVSLPVAPDTVVRSELRRDLPFEADFSRLPRSWCCCC